MELSGDEWLTGQELGDAEAEALDRVGPLVGDRVKLCAMLKGVRVEARGPGTWTVDGVEAGGTADCDARLIEVGEPNVGPWQFSALTHEIVHVWTGCNGHRDWTARGIDKALNDIYFSVVP
jgi:hypothetical protein